MSYLILVPSELEMAHLLPKQATADPGPLKTWSCGTQRWAVCGVGPAAAAFSTGNLIQTYRPDAVLMLGIAGAYPSSGLEPLDLVQADEECFADLGHREQGAFHTLDDMKIPVLPTFSEALGARYSLKTRASDLPTGLFLTLSQVTSDIETANVLSDQFEALCENMEGAGAALACRFHGVAFSQIRTISNMVGPRDISSWRIRDSLARLATYVVGLLEESKS